MLFLHRFAARSIICIPSELVCARLSTDMWQYSLHGVLRAEVCADGVHHLYPWGLDIGMRRACSGQPQHSTDLVPACRSGIWPSLQDL